MKNKNDIVQCIFSIAREAGAEILEIYRSAGIAIDHKKDGSPYTIADKRSHQIISTRLKQYFPSYPVISEESVRVPYAERKDWKRFWLVDPIDGTRGFVNKTDEFTINIALIDSGVPVLGITHLPVQNVTYFAYNRKSYRSVGNSIHNANIIKVRNANLSEITVVSSRDHAGPKVKALLERLPGATTKSMGSSLKFCLVADGSADLYYRDVPTMEWDTAAGQAIVEAAGGAVFTEEGQPLQYNKKSLQNSPLLIVGDKSINWKKWVE